MKRRARPVMAWSSHVDNAEAACVSSRDERAR